MKQTAGHDALGEFAPEFAHLNDDVLFGEVWSREDKLSLKLRSIATISALIGKGITDNSLHYHLATARKNGVTKQEMAELLTHLAFYAGWPNAWAAFNQAKEVYAEDLKDPANAHGGMFGLGQPNDAYAQYFVGQSYLNVLSKPGDPLAISNVTFEPGCRNNWHIHHAASGDVVEIPANVKHWHGAKQNSWFSHLAFGIPGTETSNEWLEPVDDEAYGKLD